MWDARFESIKDRKLNELVIFSAMVRTDPANRHELLDIIAKIGRDLDVLDALSKGNPVPKSEPILYTVYRGRLSKYESLDEYILDQCREVGSDNVQECIEEALRLAAPNVMAPERIAAPADSPRLSPVEAQVRIEAPEEPIGIEPPAETERIDAPEEPERLDAPDEVGKIEAPETPQKLDAPEEKPRLDAPASDDSVFDLIVPVDDAVTLKKVREMKDRKIDFFIDAEMSGRFKDEACEDVISFLKTDIALIDKILAINITSKTDIENGIREIIQFVHDADEPKYQKIYLNSLDYNEKEDEAEYNNVLRRLEDVINDRYLHLVGDSQSLFFE